LRGNAQIQTILAPLFGNQFESIYLLPQRYPTTQP
jgi:hypothetical protein